MSDLSNDAYIVRVAIIEEAASIRAALTAPHVIYKPALYPDGTKWCALFGDDLMSGVAGFGDTPAEAMADFDKAWTAARTPAATLRAKL
jgi:hypothetical protein